MTCLVNLRMKNQYGKSVGFELEPFGVFGGVFIIGPSFLLNHVSSKQIIKLPVISIVKCNDSIGFLPWLPSERPLKSEFAFFQSLSRLFQPAYFVTEM